MKPCKDCTERTATCHIDCKAYKIYSVGEHVKKAEEKMNLKRKRERRNRHKTRCCGTQMTYKESYGIFVCERCGKSRKVEE